MIRPWASLGAGLVLGSLLSGLGTLVWANVGCARMAAYISMNKCQRRFTNDPPDRSLLKILPTDFSKNTREIR